jgi:hypothetical protein
MSWCPVLLTMMVGTPVAIACVQPLIVARGVANAHPSPV